MKTEKFKYKHYHLLIILLVLAPLGIAASPDSKPINDAKPIDFITCTIKDTCNDNGMQEVGKNIIIILIVFLTYIIIRYSQRAKNG